MTNLDRNTTPELADLPEIDLPLHQRRLKAALMSSWQPQRSGRPGTWKSIINYFTMSKKHLAYGGVSLALAIIAIFGGIVYHNGTPQAKADELVKNSITTVSTLSSTELAKLMKELDFDLNASLAEAKQAKDLVKLTPAQYAQENIGFTGPNPTDDGLSYLKYTDPNGNKVFLGIDSQNIPRAKFMYMKDGAQKAYGEAQIVPANPNEKLPVINPQDLPAGSLQTVPAGGGVQVITGSGATQ